MRPSVIASSFFVLTKLLPHLRPALWRFWYDSLATRDSAGELLFMNYGYDGGGFELPLAPSDEPFRYAIQLYAHVVSGVELRDRDVLEVGSGRGGGGSFLIRYLKPRSYTGVDLSDAAIKWCQQQLSFPNGRWICGRADKIPVADSSIDAVVNVESSHTYPSMAEFLSEVFRVLRPGGYFAFCDVRTSDQLPELDRQLSESGLSRVAFRVITQHVISALDGITPKREQQIERYVPSFFQPAFRDFAGVQHSVLYNMLVQQQLHYVSSLLRKPH